MPRVCAAIIACLLVMVARPLLAAAVYPEFTARYSVTLNGIKTAKVVFSLSRNEQGEYLYQQKSEAVGLVATFAPAKSRQRSHWRFIDNHLVVSEFESRRKGGDDDDNAHIIFDWEQRRAKNIGAGEHWDIAIPEGTLDGLTVQLLMSLDLMRGKTQFDYPVVLRGRIKHFQFKKVAEETLELPLGIVKTVKIKRLDDDKDQSWTWVAPSLHYFPVRFLKHKKNGLKIEIVLEKINFQKPVDTAAPPTETPAAPSPLPAQ